MFTLGQEHIMEEASKPQPIMFTGGAVPVLNKKGDLVMYLNEDSDVKIGVLRVDCPLLPYSASTLLASPCFSFLLGKSA